MIKKTLMCGRNQMFLATPSQPRDIPGKEFTPVEVEVPLDVLWECEALFTEVDYINSHFQEPLKVVEIYKKIMKILNPFVIIEKDRLWLAEKLKGAQL